MGFGKKSTKSCVIQHIVEAVFPQIVDFCVIIKEKTETSYDWRKH